VWFAARLLMIADTGHGVGYRIVARQGDTRSTLATRSGVSPLQGSFQIVDGNRIDGTADTNGISVTTANLGAAFPHDVVVAQDGSNSGHQNFKLVPIERII